MKYIITIVCLGFMTGAFAGETKTECQSMNESREKIVKDPATLKTKNKTEVIRM